MLNEKQKKAVEGFVKGLLEKEAGLKLGEMDAPGNGMSQEVEWPVLSGGTFTGFMFLGMVVKASVTTTDTISLKYLKIECRQNYGETKMYLPVDVFEFDLDGNLLTKGLYKAYSKLKEGDVFMEHAWKCVLLEKNEEQCKYRIVEGEYEGRELTTKHLNTLVLLLPKEEEQGGAA